MIYILIRDRGVGIAPQRLAQVFEPFHTSSPMPSHGIGLAMCKNTITAFGGAIWCTSVVGQGSEFHIELPRIATPPRISRSPSFP